MGRRKKLIDKNAGIRLQQARTMLGYSCRQFGGKLGISEGYISYLENGKRFLSRPLMERMRAEFHINMKWLEEGDGDVFEDGYGGTVEEGAGIKEYENLPAVSDGMFWERVRQIRHVMNISQSDIADKMGCSRPNISYMEKTHSRPTIEAVEAVRSLMPDVSIAWLLNGSGDILDMPNKLYGESHNDGGADDKDASNDGADGYLSSMRKAAQTTQRIIEETAQEETQGEEITNRRGIDEFEIVTEMVRKFVGLDRGLRNNLIQYAEFLERVQYAKRNEGRIGTDIARTEGVNEAV